jgi:myosin heavy subunit
LANYWQTFKSTTQQELVSGKEASKQEIKSLTRQLSKLQMDLQKQKATNQRGSAVDETRTEVLALEAELLQQQKDAEKDAKDREGAYKYESAARARDQAAGIERMQTIGEQNLKQVTAEMMQLQRELQNELAEQDTMYLTKIAAIDADNAGEIQALQARLQKVTNQYQDYKLTTDARQQVPGDIQTTNENYDALVQENLTLQTTLNEKNEATKQQDVKAQDFMKLFESLEEELPQFGKDLEQTVEGMQATYELKREGQAEDKSSPAKTLKELKEKARRYVVSLEEQSRDKAERVRNELTNLVAEREGLISKQQAIIDAKDHRLAVTEGITDITDNLRIRLFEKGNEIRNAEAMMARQNELIAELSADRGSVKALSQQALKLFQSRAVAQVDLLTHQVTGRVQRDKKYRDIPHNAPNDIDDGEDNDDWSVQEEDEGDDQFDSDFADWHDDPKVLVSAWSTAVSRAKTLTHPAWRRLQNLVSHASRGSARRLWKQPPLTFSEVQRDQLFPPPEAITWEERRKTHPQAHGTRSIRTSFGLVKVYNKAASPRAPMEQVTYPRAHGTRSIRTSFGAVEVYNRVASPTPLMEEVTYPRVYGTRSIQTSFGTVEVYNRVPIPTAPTEKVFSDGHLQRQMTHTS